MIAAQYGAKVINGGTSFLANVAMIKVTDDAVFDILKINDETDNVIADYIVGSIGGTIKAGTIIRPVNDGYFSEIKLTSGAISVALYGQ